MTDKLHYYITTSIAYANAEPHIGFAMEMVQADVLARYFRGQGADVKFVTGTDEHGIKIHRAASDAKKPVQQFVDANTVKFQDLTKALNLSNDHFVRTTDAQHRHAAQTLWKACSKDIYTAEYEGLYCVGHEAYVTDKDLVEGMCPEHKTKPEHFKEKNYFFKLSKFGGQIKELIQTNKIKIVPDSRKNEILAFLDQGLEDISISRSKTKLPWGVEVPGDKDQVMYVWFDALSNYISALGYPDQPDFDLFWPANVQVIGKDILRFHAAIWPGMLLSAGIDLPECLYVHGFIESGGHKMSKSLGNVIDPFLVIDKYGADGLRYYLLRQIPSYGDGDFSWEHLEAVYNADLANDLGNLVQRSAVMVQKYLGGDLGEVPPHSHDSTEYQKALRDFRFDRALDEVWGLVRGINQYIDEVKPWELAKTDLKHNGEVLHHIVADILQLSRLLLPFMPDTAAKIAGTFAGGKVDDQVGILFPKLELADEITTEKI